VTSSRLEAFSDAVIAILMTIMVLELRPPTEADWNALSDLFPVFLTYILSFVFLGIYWNNHHHMLAATDRVNGKILWANLHLLFWLSLFPFMTGWLGNTEEAPRSLPTAVYGAVLLLAAIAYYILKTAIISAQGPDSRIAKALGNDFKGRISPLLYAAAIPLAYVGAWISIGIYVLVALMWLVPDRRIEATYAASSEIE
jgi:TMEM175 potassium channel family protein